MKAVLISEAGAAPYVGDIDVPEPGEGQVLVKTIYTAINPVDAFLAGGLLVESWPLTPGADIAGTVVKAGPNAVSPLGQPFREGDEVFSCSRLGMKGYGPWAEQLLMDAPVTILVPSNLTLAQASTAGVAILTAALGIFDPLGIPLPDPASLPGPRNEWALVFGGAGSVGQFAVQLLKVCGFKVLATCSAKSFGLVKSLGAAETIDYKLSESEIVEKVKSITGGELNYAYDCVSVNNTLLTAIYSALPPPSSSSSSKPRLYTTTNDWDPYVPPTPFPPLTNPTNPPSPTHPFTTRPVLLGPIGRPSAGDLNAKLTSYIPVLYALLETDTLKTNEYVVEGEGVQGILGAWEVQKSGVRGGRKIVVKVGRE